MPPSLSAGDSSGDSSSSGSDWKVVVKEVAFTADGAMAVVFN
jgi:hypothetical protein